MIYQDLHMHTIYDDGADTPEKMVCAAISRGLGSVGISIHSPIDNETWCAKPDSLPQFVSELHDLKKKYESSIRLYCGIEFDLYSKCDLSVFDYVIGSTHMINMVESNLSVDNTPDELNQIISILGSQEDFVDRYFNQVCQLSELDEVDIIGHLDLPTKFNEKISIINIENIFYRMKLEETIRNLCEAGKVFEVNSGAISRGYRTSPYPDSYALSLIKKYNGRVLLSSDAHSSNCIAYSFDESLKLIKSFGFESIAYYDGQKFIDSKI